MIRHLRLELEMVRGEMNMLLEAGWMDGLMFWAMLALLIYVFAVNTISSLHKYYLAFHAIMLMWPLSQWILHTSDQMILRQLASYAGLISLLSLGPCWVLFARLFTKPLYPLSRGAMGLIAAPVLLFVPVIVLKPEWWFDLSALPVTSGQVGWLFGLYILAISFYFILATSDMLRVIRGASSSMQRQQIILLLIGIAIFACCTCFDLIYNVLLEGHVAKRYGITSLGVVLSDLFIIYVIQRYRVLDIVSIARREVVDTMTAGVVVVDGQDIVIDVNRGMHVFFPVRKGVLLPMKEILGLIPDSTEREEVWTQYYFSPYEHLDTEIHIMFQEDVKPSYVSLHISPIYDDNKRWVGRLLTFHDVTQLRVMVEQMNQKNTTLFERNLELIHIQQELQYANQKLQEMAITDPLTNCYNRRHLLEQMEEKVPTCVSSHQPFSIVLFDIDHFKTINDNYGHVVGDEVLSFVSNIVRKELHHSDIFARYGGEEFVIFMPGVNAHEAYSTAERLIELIKSATPTIASEAIMVTVSIGWVAYEGQELSLGDDVRSWILALLGEADRHMYEAKSNGRNGIRPRLAIEEEDKQVSLDAARPRHAALEASASREKR